MVDLIITSRRRTGLFLRAVALAALAMLLVAVQDRAAAYTKEQCKMQHDQQVADCKSFFAGSDQLTVQDRYNCVSSVNGAYLDCVAAASDNKASAIGGDGGPSPPKKKVGVTPPSGGLLESSPGLSTGPAPSGGSRGTRGGGSGTLY